MSDIMTPIPFGRLMNRLLQEHENGACFGMTKCWKADPSHFYTLFGRKLETQIGPAAGPNTQLAQNIIAAYYGGSRFFELKTVQKMDGRELAECVKKPCITAEDECYNCEWSTELEITEARDEYIKAWFALKVISKEWGLGAADGFQFNVSCGYDLEGIKGAKVDGFLEAMTHADTTAVYQECKEWLQRNLSRFAHFDAADLAAITPDIVNSVTVSTLHGCPPQEIEAIASYLITEKHLHTLVKCNPTLLGYEEARRILDTMGYDYIAFTDFHFKDDLQFADAVPMLTRLKALAESQGLEFGVKLTNTFPVDVTRNELPSTEMYMSGKSLYALSMQVARKLSDAFDGKLRISYSGGADYFNISDIVGTGIWPVTMATTLLKSGGYARLIQMAELLSEKPAEPWTGVNVFGVQTLAEQAQKDHHYRKPVKPLPNRKSEAEVPLVDCFTAPCSDRCPIHQDITTYGRLVNEGRFEEALRVILDKNPLPFMTGNICAHGCQSACTRNQYESPVQIRGNKLIAARKGYDAVLPTLAPTGSSKKKVAIVGAGPAGIAAAFYLARAGAAVTVYDEASRAGGVVANIIPSFRLPAEEIQKDVALAEAMGAKFVLNTRIDDLTALQAENDAVILAVGAHKETPLQLTEGSAMNAHHFLQAFKDSDGQVPLGKNVAVVGGGNTAMDTARAAVRNAGVDKVYLVYRRTRRYMPAEAEELEEAIADGVIFSELLAPVSLDQKNGSLLCHRMELSDMDASGRRAVRETEECVSIPCDTVIASIGERVDGSFYEKNGIAVNEKGLPVLSTNTMESSVKNVYVIGDGAKGASIIVKAIADAKLACEAILNTEIGTHYVSEMSDAAVYEKKGILAEAPACGTADKRCLGCDHICESCVDVCPNRANMAIKVPGRDMHQIIHIDYMCNECGNCKTFCPYASAPYQDKLTLFANEKDMHMSKNDGFVFLTAQGDAAVRLGGQEYSYRVGEKNSRVFFRIAEIVDTVFRDYNYLIL